MAASRDGRKAALSQRPGLLLLAALGALLTGCAAPSQLGRRDQQRIVNRTFIVTGASSGLGRGVALKLAGYGANVVLAARRTDVLDQLAAQVSAAGGRPLVVGVDVGKPDDVAHLTQAAVERFGRIDVWINDAGVVAIGRFDQIPVEDQARVIDVNLKGAIYGSYAAMRQFRQQGFGTLVNVASVEGRLPLAYQASYSASKHGIVGLDAALNQELRLDGLRRTINVVTIEPWAVDTPIWQHAANYSGHTPRVIPMDGPQPTVDAIVWASIHPSKEVAVGWKAEASVISHQILPGLAEDVAGSIVRREQFGAAPPAPPTSGSLHAPMPAGTTVEGDTRARIKAEDQRSAEQRQ